MYLTQPERGKNILQNEVPSDFVFILKIIKNPQKMTVTGRNRERLQLPSFRESLNLVAGFWKLETRLTTQPVS